MTIANDLELAQQIIRGTLMNLKNSPDKIAVDNLIEACMKLEEHYEEFCKGCDQDFYEEEGNTYRDGISLEFYIESSLWHDVSKALRELKPKGEPDV